MKRFYSKIGWEVVILVVSVLGTTGALLVALQAWAAVAVHLAVLLFIGHLMATTFYQIEGDQLRIKSGFIVDKTIAIDTVRTIQKSNSLFSSPAASFDRLEIIYNTHDAVLISPRFKEAFLAELLKINPAIKINGPV